MNFLINLTMSVSDDASIKQSVEEVWYLKEIFFKRKGDEEPRRVKVVTQNFNGSVLVPQQPFTSNVHQCVV